MFQGEEVADIPCIDTSLKPKSSDTINTMLGLVFGTAAHANAHTTKYIDTPEYYSDITVLLLLLRYLLFFFLHPFRPTFTHLRTNLPKI